MSIEANLARVREEIATACAKANRAEADVSLMAVSKMHPVDSLLEAYAAGQRLFGENRVQEFADKLSVLGGMRGCEYHLIGPLQSNKASKAAELFDSIDTVDSLKLANRLNTAAETLGKQLQVYIEVKLSHEESKHGIAPTELAELLMAFEGFEHIVAVGLMTVPPWSEDPETARPYFQALRRLRDQERTLHPALTLLSMGMSGDFRVAIEEGSNCVRVGTAIFGKRPKAQASALLQEG